MVKSTTSFSNSGLRDFLVQRVTSLIIAAYIIFLLGFILINPNLDYGTWHGLFAQNWMRVITLLFLLSLMFHSWIGIWIVSTDYLKKLSIQLFVQVIVILALFSFVIWGTMILWGL